MAESKNDGNLIRYYCTAGKGMELFLLEELKKNLAAEDVYQIPGKVIFSSTADVNRLCQLKAAERIFLFLKQDHPVSITAKTNPAKAASALQSRLLGDIEQWTSAVRTWTRLQREMVYRSYPVRLSKGSTREDSVVQKRNEPSGTGKKRKRDDDVDEEKWTFPPQENTSGIRNRHNTLTDQSKDDAKKANTSGEASQIPMRLSTTQLPSAPISFRINCKCSGSLSRCFTPQEVSKVIGVGLSRHLGWKTDLKNPQLEVNIHLSDDHCLMGIPLSRLPLANRCYIKNTGLRSTIAWAIASLAQIQPGFCVLDPMCGVGTILIEAAQEHTDALFLGMDIDDGQIQRANENIEFAEVENRIHLTKASSMMIPLSDGRVDVVVCDLPFGRKFGNKVDMAAKLPLILTEMERVLCVGGTLVLLLSPQLSCLLKKLLEKSHTETSSNNDSKSQAGLQSYPPPPLPAGRVTLKIDQEIHSSPIQDLGRQTDLHTFHSSLKHQESFRVSLGLIDGIIHKYVKTII
ncbi:THUMP domain-containing protein 2 [Takifugu rubripes]|uniref:THUMP domain-containing protein 2 n=1 Tax=Takifugu rubripes TaxID=31033 RepID=UPI0005D142DA|nr:THUMP domain-containing protein 2 [Takifugu rubripes]|eukprot:XP_011601405.1 PREDICTED: THUMP domain-containing protein 2 [Takifugu rubripes]